MGTGERCTNSKVFQFYRRKKAVVEEVKKYSKMEAQENFGSGDETWIYMEQKQPSQ